MVDGQKFRFFLSKKHPGDRLHCHPWEPEFFSDETDFGSDVRMVEPELKKVWGATCANVELYVNGFVYP